MIDTLDRKSVQETALVNMAQIMTRDQYATFKATLEAMPDDVFWQIMAECIATAKDCSYKELAKLSKEARSVRGINARNSAMNDLPMQIISAEETSQVWRRILASRPSDEIKLTGDEDSRLIRLWEKESEDVAIPSDLFFANTIPLLDCRITVDETKCCENGQVFPYRVVIFPDYAERIQLADEDEPVNVGAIVNNPVTGPCCFTPFYVVKGVDSIMFSGVGYHGVPEENIRRAQSAMTMQDVSQMAISCLETWYGIQIALQHPNVREVFRHPKAAPDITDAPNHSAKRKNRVKYIKVHIINSKDIDTAMFGESKTYTRRALVWYVIGHWRTIKSGAKVFVKPCWKGPLRDVKVNLAERERTIVQATGGAF